MDSIYGGRISDIKALQECKKTLPRYLFRAYSASSGNTNATKTPSKIQRLSKLNTRRAIVPHAFLSGKGHQTVSQIPQLFEMLKHHLSGQIGPGVGSEFSSWAASLLVVFCLAEFYYKRETPKGSYICMIDLKRLKNEVYHVPDLFRYGFGMKHLEVDATYPHEYLVHGLVAGPGYVTVPYQAIRKHVLQLCPSIENSVSLKTAWGHAQREVTYSTPSTRLTLRQMRLMNNIAAALKRRSFALPLLVALFCIHRRFDSEASILTSHNFLQFKAEVEFLLQDADLETEERWKAVTLPFPYFEIEQMTYVMRALLITKIRKKGWR